VAAPLEDTLVCGYRQLAAETPRRRIDVELRALDLLFAVLFGVFLAPVTALIALLVLTTSGRPVLYRGERVARGGSVFTMLKFRTLRADAESRLGPFLGEELVRRTEGEYTRIGRWLKASQLVLPLDTHTGRISQYLGLTRRRTLGWVAALEVTAALRQCDPGDPTRYDFSMARLGILDLCQRRYRAELDGKPEAWRPLLQAAGNGDITLLFSAHDVEHNNAIVLKVYLDERLSQAESENCLT